MKSAAKRAPNPRKGRPTPKLRAVQSYHHGDLHDALLKAAEALLEREGMQGLTLRAAAREAGVSHAAPTHHFRDMTGLLSELAAVGFRRFAKALREAVSAAPTPRDRLNAMGMAYVAFARAHPAMFMLMFRSERLDTSRPALKEAMQESNAAFAGGFGARRESPGTGQPPAALVADMVRAWSIVHGFAVLLLDHRLEHLVSLWPDHDPIALLGAVLFVKPAG